MPRKQEEYEATAKEFRTNLMKVFHKKLGGSH